jgi:hypothetical protein
MIREIIGCRKPTGREYQISEESTHSIFRGMVFYTPSHATRGKCSTVKSPWG